MTGGDPAPAAPGDPDEPSRVAASEADILIMARALILGPDALDDIWSLLCAGRVVPPQIGVTCAELLEDTLCQTWHALLRRGGARPRATLAAGGAVVRGRLWQRHPPTPLAFTSATLRLIRWLVAQSFASPPSSIAELAAVPLAIGDQVMVYLALDATRLTAAAHVIAAQPFVRAAPLAWLGFAPLLAGGGEPPASFAGLTEGAGAVVVEALADELARRWYAGELPKRRLEDPDQLIALGAAQDAVLGRFMDACDARGRRDLAGFVIEAAAPLLARDLPPAPASLDPRTPLLRRAKARLAAGALLRAVTRWADWDRQHRGVRYIDDDYASSQLLLQQFERIGGHGAARASGWLADLAALAPTPPASDTIVPP